MPQVKGLKSASAEKHAVSAGGCWEALFWRSPWILAWTFHCSLDSGPKTRRFQHHESHNKGNQTGRERLGHPTYPLLGTTQRLECSSFLGSILESLSQKAGHNQKGTTLEPLGRITRNIPNLSCRREAQQSGIGGGGLD